jgi:hypothetical protein
LMRWLPIKLGVGLASSPHLFPTLHIHVSWNLLQCTVKSWRSFYPFYPVQARTEKNFLDR